MTDVTASASDPANPVQAGARIRARRMALGITQTELARQAEISAAYLNLIEHDRRRIGGKLLNRLARLLDVSAAELTRAQYGRLATRLAEGWARFVDDPPPEASAEAFSLQSPEWAAFCVALMDRVDTATARAEQLVARAQNDPALRDLLHELLTAASAVRSAASILHGDQDLSPEWQARFRRNLDEDSRRLATGAANLAAWLETSGHDGPQSPEADVDQFFAAQGYHFAVIEAAADAASADAAIDMVLRTARLSSPAATALARDWLNRLARDAARLPLDALAAAAALDDNPHRMAAQLDRPLALVLRRLAFSGGVGGEGLGLLVMDQAGGVVLARPAEGAVPPWSGAACPLLPAFEALRRPYEAVRGTLAWPGLQGDVHFQAVAASEIVEDTAGRRAETSMLLRPSMPPDPSEAIPAGPGCLHCPRLGCQARRQAARMAPNRAGITPPRECNPISVAR